MGNIWNVNKACLNNSSVKELVFGILNWMNEKARYIKICRKQLKQGLEGNLYYIFTFEKKNVLK